MTSRGGAADLDRARLPRTYDIARLQEETRAALADAPPCVYYAVVPLTRAAAPAPGTTDFANAKWAEWRETARLRDSPYIREVLASLECQTTNVRLCRLEAGATLQEHTDPQLDLGLRNQVRLHVPIVTSEDVDFRLNGRPVPMRPGELWYMRLSDPHSVTNRWTRERIHLSIDVVWNPWLQDLIERGAGDARES